MSLFVGGYFVYTHFIYSTEISCLKDYSIWFENSSPFILLNHLNCKVEFPSRNRFMWPTFLPKLACSWYGSIFLRMSIYDYSRYSWELSVFCRLWFDIPLAHSIVPPAFSTFSSARLNGYHLCHLVPFSVLSCTFRYTNLMLMLLVNIPGILNKARVFHNCIT